MNLKSIKLITLILSLCSLSLSAQVTVGQLFQKPAVIGDSLSQGFYGVTVERKTQDWAYPVLVSKQAGSNVSYNVLKGPYANLEDILKLNCGPICLASAIIGGNDSTVALPTHAGITGADYTNALYTNGSCEDIRATKLVKEWYWETWYWYTYRWVTAPDCVQSDKFHQYGLRDAGTQIQIMEKVKPTFLFGTVAANHVLCTALATNLACLDYPRFEKDIRESMRRLAAMGSLKGGVLFTVPNVTAIGYLEKYTDPQNRPGFSGRKAFYRSSVSSADQVLDDTEVATITTFLTNLNNEVKAQATSMGFALADAKVLFDDIKENGRPIKSPNGYSPGSARATWPLPNQPGLFGLDGVHPNMYGHSVMANELIKAINAKYGVSIAQVSEYNAWYYDDLNRNPVDLKNFLTNNILGQAISWIIGIFA